MPIRYLNAILVPVAVAIAAEIVLISLHQLALIHYFSEAALADLGELLWISRPFGFTFHGVAWAIMLAAAFWAGFRTAGVSQLRMAGFCSGGAVMAFLVLISIGGLLIARGPAELSELREANFPFLGAMFVLAVASGEVGAWRRISRVRAT